MICYAAADVLALVRFQCKCCSFTFFILWFVPVGADDIHSDGKPNQTRVWESFQWTLRGAGATVLMISAWSWFRWYWSWSWFKWWWSWWWMIMILCQVLLYIQADEVKNRKKQRKVETEVLPQDTVGKQQYKLNKKDNTILFSNKKIDICKGGRPSPEACHCSKQEHCSLKQRD